MTAVFRQAGLALYRRRWLLSRRSVQLFILLAFINQLPAIGQIAQGNLASSLWFDTLPLSDPFIVLQSLLAGSSPAVTAMIGAALVAGFYMLFGGRIYCSWVCPINMLTDAAHWLRHKLNIKGNMTLSRELRKAVLLLALLLSLLTGSLAWEIINPITLLQRELIWGSAAGTTLLLSLFLFDLLVSRRGWCGHLCPVGAFYGVLGKFGRLRVTATQADSCKGAGCSACVKVCPEPHVLAPVVSGKQQRVTASDCTRCGACLDQCATGALSMQLDLGEARKFKGIPVVSRRDKP
ncbi:periplasmic nitrate reductase subunit NapH [Methylophaga lonarensis MPL]|uniref:Periplasmic nitrate reductase subunit NapH n=1 Tax=Methylophaga lonarensis MPL TaxID=1286106 RepID=M7P3B5_9GAMM|nr:quinol dehydrogenase ferredoxin subunit NapH [Methylophaga lonarensis]EMR14007.1 periplasmic nitrate reductase subunit NapH [Methylophaga lonarensis MPL]